MTESGGPRPNRPTASSRGPTVTLGVAICLGIWAATVMIVPSLAGRLALTVPLIVIALFHWMVLQPFRWIVVFFLADLLLPPLPVPFGDSGVHVAPFIAALGGIVSLVWVAGWRNWVHPVSLWLMIFVAVLVESLAFGAAYSGLEIAVASMARVCLFAIGVFVFLYAYAGPRPKEWGDLRTSRFLFEVGVSAALFACADFYFQFTPPAGFGDQFVWLPGAVLRRAQGLFYEASTLGNFCAFFLVMVAVSLIRPCEQSPSSRPALLLGGLVLGTALMLSYSRASVINVAVAVCVLAAIRFRPFLRTLIALAGTLVAAGIVVHLALPAFSASYWTRVLGSLNYFAQSPNQVLSGRLDHWHTLAAFLSSEPWHLVFGIGYKTLPYSDFIGGAVVADNTYLGLLAETGIVGLTVFVVLNIAVLHTGWKALHSRQPEAAFLGEWIFCFWCGQAIQMLSGDLITYWRVLPVYFWVLGAAARHTRSAK